MLGPESLRRCGTAHSNKTVGFSVQRRCGQLTADYKTTYKCIYAEGHNSVKIFHKKHCIYEWATVHLKCYLRRLADSLRYNQTSPVKPHYLQLMRDRGSHLIQTQLLKRLSSRKHTVGHRALTEIFTLLFSVIFSLKKDQTWFSAEPLYPHQYWVLMENRSFLVPFLLL